MKITNRKKTQLQNPKDEYKFIIATMEGDADDYHKFSIPAKTLEKANELAIYCEVMSLQYPRGRGGGGGFYNHLDFFHTFFNDGWHYEDSEYMDSWESYSLVYYDKDGIEFSCSITLDEEDKEKIASYEVKH